jgi:hypothetical protein
MALPWIQGPAQRAKRDHLSPLMRAKANSLQGEIVNACPFGCEDEELDRFGYCRHLVGFTDKVGPKDKALPAATYEPRIVLDDAHEDDERQMVNGRDPQPVRKDDVLMRITSSYRVYRDVDGKGREPTPIREEGELETLTRDDVRQMLREELHKALEELTKPRPAATTEEAA